MQRLQTYTTRWQRVAADGALGVRTFTVMAYNQDEAYVASVRALDAAGEKKSDWWYWGSERV